MSSSTFLWNQQTENKPLVLSPGPGPRCVNLKQIRRIRDCSLQRCALYLWCQVLSRYCYVKHWLYWCWHCVCKWRQKERRKKASKAPTQAPISLYTHTHLKAICGTQVDSNHHTATTFEMYGNHTTWKQTTTFTSCTCKYACNTLTCHWVPHDANVPSSTDLWHNGKFV